MRHLPRANSSPCRTAARSLCSNHPPPCPSPHPHTHWQHLPQVQTPTGSKPPLPSCIRNHISVTFPQAWRNARAVFATPQVLSNDLAAAAVDGRQDMIARISLIVVDEAHRASGEYAYCKVMNMLYEGSSGHKPRVLALTATPGNSWAALQETVTSLRLTSILHRSESSPDVLRHVHPRLCTSM
jgi:ERCC4-related helicase